MHHPNINTIIQALVDGSDKSVFMSSKTMKEIAMAM